MDTIQEFQQTMESHIESEGFNIFNYTTASYSEFMSEIEWDDVKNWQKFFLIAKNEGILTFYKQIEIFSKNEFDTIKDDLDEEEHYDLIKSLKSNLDEISSISFSWFKNNIRHSITKKVSWMVELEQELTSLDDDDSLNEVEDRSLEHEQQREIDVPENLIGEEEEIAKKLLEFWQKENPTQSYLSNSDLVRVFWEPYDELFRFNEKHRAFQRKVQDLTIQLHQKNEKEKIPDLVEKCVEWAVENKRSKTTQIEIREFLEDMGEVLDSNNLKSIIEKTNRQLEVNEKEKIPDLVGLCVEWAVENNMYKPTQSGIKGFLAEIDIDLSTTNFKILFSKVTSELNSIK
jgi:hypothetical protein